MNIDITARNFNLSNNLKTFVEDKANKLIKYDKKITLIKVIFLKESRAEKVELIVNSKNNQYFTKCYSSVFEKTFIKAIDNIIVQIKKTKIKY